MNNLTVDQQSDVTVFHFRGQLSAGEVVLLEPGFTQAALRPGARVVIDLSQVELLTTPAITMFMKAMNFQRQNSGRVIFTGTQGAIDKLLHVCRLDLIMTIVHDPAAAVAQAAR